MTDKTALWDKLGKTDPAHVKSFKRAGGFSGTAIKPMWSYRRMTEEFGPCGEGWGVNEPSFQVVPGVEGEMLVYCTVSVWHATRDNVVFGVGGDKVVGKNKYGLSSDDEAFKKSFTDAVTNALKLIGVGADVHMGMFDDNKYVNTMREEFAHQPAEQTTDDPPRKPNGKPEKGWREDGSRTSYALKNEGSWDTLKAELDADLVDCNSLLKLEALKSIYRVKARDQHWNRQFMDALAQEFAKVEDYLIAEREQEEA